MTQGDYHPQLQMVWPQARLGHPPSASMRAGYALRTYRPGDESRFFEVMDRAGWPGWDEKVLQPWLWRVLPEGWFLAIHQPSSQIVASCMALHDHTWTSPFCAELGWLAADPAHTGAGLGMALAAAVTTRCIQIGYLQIHLYTEHWRLAALKIYLRLGYVPLLNAPEVAQLWEAVCEQLHWPFTPDHWRS